MTSPDPSTVCWVASYPKPGNTWLRFLIAGMHQGLKVTSADMEIVVPDIHERGRRGDVQIYNPVHGTCYIKTHWRFDLARPVFSRSNAGVYVLRNPMDVLASHLNYTQFPNAALRPVFANQFIEKGGAPQWIPHGMGTWLENARSWIKGPDRALVLIYEDLLANPKTEISRLATYLDMDVSADQVEGLAAAYRFDELRRREEEELEQQTDGMFRNYAETRSETSLFMNAGKSNYFRDVLPEDTVDLGLRAFRTPIEQVQELLGRSIESWSFLGD